MADILENPVDLIDDAYEQEIQVEQEMIEVVAYRSYNRLDDKPQINGVELVGNKTSSDLGITAQIESAVNSEAQARAQADNTLQGKIDTEKLARQQADSTLQGNIDAEETARKAADKDIQDVLDGETLARQNADTALGGRIDTEIHDRQVADIALQGQIDAITSKSDVVDVVANYVALQAYDTSSLGNNDVIKVLDDETHEDALTYYRWSTTTQTWTYIGQEAPYYSKSQTDTLLLGKQNTIDSSHKLSADLVDDTSTTNKFVTASDITNWNGKQDALTAGAGIDITGGVISTPAIVPEVVAELPATGEEGKLYLTPKAHTTQTATGNPITASVSEEAGAIESFQLDGDTFQQSYNGSNLLNAVPATSGYLNGLSATIENDGSIHLTGVSTANYSNFSATQFKTLAAGNYVLSVDKNLPFKINLRVVYSDSTTETFYRESELDLPISLAKQVTSFYIYAGSTISGTTYDETFKVWLSSGATATSFEPYVGGVPSPNPDYPQPIQTVTGLQTVEIVGKNKIDPTILQNAWDNNDGVSIVYSSQYVRTVEYTPVNASTTYTLSYLVRGSVVMRGNILQYDSNKTFISSISIANNITFTTTSSTAFVRFNLYHPDSIAPNDVTNLQLELGSQASSYTPYSKQTLPINLGSIELCKLGTYQDYIWKDGGDWKVHRATATITLDGTEDWVYAGNYNYARCPSYTFVDKPLGGTSVGLQLSNYFGVIADWGTFRDSTGQNAFFPLLDEGYKISIRNTGCSSVENYKSWVAANKPSFYYPVATPTDTTITDQNLIAQLEAIRTASLQNGANTITNTAAGSNLAGDMEIGYYGFAPRNRYDKWLWLDINNEYEQIGS